MQRPLFPEWADEFVLARDLESSAEAGLLRRRRTNGELVAILPGVYLPAVRWRSTSHEARALILTRAAALTSRRAPVFSHESAAALWRLPLIGASPQRAHVTISPEQGGRSTRALQRHATWRPIDPVMIDGLLVTSLARTVIDIAATLPFSTAIAAADAALRRSEFPLAGLPCSQLTSATLLEEQQLLPLRHGAARALRVVEFADGRAQLPGESLSRVSMLRAGIPAPQLQERLRGASGKEYVVDFWWPECSLIGEFDGRAKYADPVYLDGRTTAEAHFEEKLREDDLRLPGRSMCRWDWSVAGDPRALLRRLTLAGLRC